MKLVVSLTHLAGSWVFIATAAAAEPTPAEVFEKRIAPIFKSPNPSSCVQCHLAGVDLKDYILPDADKTFRSLRDQGLIDLEKPEKSKIVKLIDMGRGRQGAGGSREEPQAGARSIRGVDRGMRGRPKVQRTPEVGRQRASQTRGA